MSFDILFRYAVHGAELLAAALLAFIMLRRASASWRHASLAAGLAAVLILPLADALLPCSEVIAPIAPHIILFVTAGSTAVAPSPAGDISIPSMGGIVVLIWAIGSAALLMRSLTALQRRAWTSAPSSVNHIGESIAHSLGIRRRVRFAETSEWRAPHTVGFFRPVVVLPGCWREWSEGRMHVALTHELMHVARHDWLWEAVAQCVVALHWFNPLSWLTLRLLRREREIACDDALLLRGLERCDYSDHLIEIAAGRGSTSPQSAVAMAGMSQLEVRVRSILDPKTKRGGVPMKGKCAAAVLAAAAVILLSISEAPAQSGGASFSGAVLDASGARIPDAVVLLRNAPDGKREITRTDSAGEFRFTNLPAATYNVEVSTPGFQLYRHEGLALKSGAAEQMQVVLNLGRINETVNVKGQRPAGIATTSGGPPQRVRVGGNVKPARALKMIQPTYPPHLKATGVEGSVLLDAVIGLNGKMLNARVLNSLVHPDFAAAALDAVKQWEYEPTFLNGQPVEVATGITVNFRLSE